MRSHRLSLTADDGHNNKGESHLNSSTAEIIFISNTVKISLRGFCLKISYKTNNLLVSGHNPLALLSRTFNTALALTYKLCLC